MKNELKIALLQSDLVWENPLEKNLPDVINYLASNYILEQNFQDMVNL